MGTQFHQRHLAATALIALLAVGGYSFFGADSVDPSLANGDLQSPIDDAVVYPTVEPETEVLGITESAIESALVEGQSLQMNDISGFTGDAEVDLPTLDPAVIVIEDLGNGAAGREIEDLRVKYVSATDELVIGLNSLDAVRDSEDVTIALDLDNDGSYDLAFGADGPVVSIADFSQLAGNADSLSFGINAVIGSDALDPAIAVELDATVGGFVFADTNADGIQDPDEPGVEGITVYLFDENATTVAETTTDAAGKYEISVPSGTYAVEFLPRPGDVFSPLHAGEDRSVDSNADATTGQTSFTFIGPGEENLTLDAGLGQP